MTTPLSLREARQREAEARLAWVRKGFQPAPDEYRAWLTARRATDEALVRAVCRWFVVTPTAELAKYDRDPETIDWSAVLDAVEREETER